MHQAGIIGLEMLNLNLQDICTGIFLFQSRPGFCFSWKEKSDYWYLLYASIAVKVSLHCTLGTFFFLKNWKNPWRDRYSAPNPEYLCTWIQQNFQDKTWISFKNKSEWLKVLLKMITFHSTQSYVWSLRRILWKQKPVYCQNENLYSFKHRHVFFSTKSN